MSIYLDKARELRERTDVHFNCAQSVAAAFSSVFDFDEELLVNMGTNFGSGMGRGGTCGAITGALMVLGLAGIKDSAHVFREVKEKHENLIDCRDLLRKNAQEGRPKKEHCDEMVYELVSLTEDILRKEGCIE